MRVGERLLRAVSRPPSGEDLPGGTVLTTLDNALDFIEKTVPGFVELIQGRKVLDYGCGWGWQAAAMVRRGAREVFGLDIVEESLERARQTARREGLTERATFGISVPREHAGSFDVAVSCSSFEHFSDPARVLEHMGELVRPGGRVIITFAEPWYSPYGSHMSFFTRVPWVNVLWSERTVMAVRESYRDDGARRYEDVPGGLNRMTLSKFERILRASCLEIEWIRYYSTRGLPLVHRLPFVREFLTSSAAASLRAGC